jgi:NADH-quinone oxidoreductase subunit J
MSSAVAAAATGPVGVTPNTGEQVTFAVCATLAVIGALGMVTARKAVHSALFIAMTMVNLAVLYIAQDALFLGMVQIIVYTGAVMMLFIFVLMVVGVDASDSRVETLKGQRPIAVLAFLGIAGLMISALVHALDGTAITGLIQANTAYGGNVQGIAALTFGRFLLAFEATSALLITAAVGAMVLTHRERLTPRKSQAELARDRFASGQHPGNRPNPGVYARNNAVDMPALLPDGTGAELSVPTALRLRGSVHSIDRLALEHAQHLAAHEPVLVPASEAHEDGPESEAAAQAAQSGEQGAEARA